MLRFFVRSAARSPSFEGGSHAPLGEDERMSEAELLEQVLQRRDSQDRTWDAEARLAAYHSAVERGIDTTVLDRIYGKEFPPSPSAERARPATVASENKIGLELHRRAAEKATIPARLGSWLAAKFNFSPGALGAAAAAVTLIIVGQAGVITKLAFDDHNDGVLALMGFNPQTSAADIVALLQTRGVSIVGGPDREGSYQVRLPVPATSKDETAKLITQLRSDRHVAYLRTSPTTIESPMNSNTMWNGAPPLVDQDRRRRK